jgi:hypothetical protein
MPASPSLSPSVTLRGAGVVGKQLVAEKRLLGDVVVRKLDIALMALGDAKTAQATKKVVDAVAALQTYARRQKLSEEVKQRGFAIWLEAMAQLGRYLREEPMAKAGRPPLIDTESVSINDPTLADRHISLKESALAQKIAALPEETQSMIMEGTTKLNTAFRNIEEAKRKQDLQRPVAVGGGTNLCRVFSNVSNWIIG